MKGKEKIMKKISALLLALLIAVMALAFVGCTDTESTSTDGSAEKETLKVGVTIFEPLNYKDDNGEWTGFETEFTKAVAEKLNMDVEFVEIEWDNKVFEINAGNIDCIWNGMTVTPELQEALTLSDPYIKNMQVVICKKENAEKYSTLDAMKDVKIVAEAGSAGEKAIEADEILSKANYTSIAKQLDALTEVKSGTADVAVIDYVMARASVGEGTSYEDLAIVDGIELSVEEYAIGFRKDDELATKVNEAIKELIADGTLNKIAEKYDMADSLLCNQ